MKKTKIKNKSGITLIALVITIIVMLILVAVTINMAVNGGLFSYAGKATLDTNNAYASEQNLGSGAVTVDGKEYESIDDYLAGNEKVVLPTGWSKVAESDLATKCPNWDTTKVTPIVDNATTPHYVPLPKGYSISTKEGEQAVDTGLVIKDSNGNEFVWIPVASIKEATYDDTYVGASNYEEPKKLTSTWSSSSLSPKPEYDSQNILTELYGCKEGTETPYFSYANDFKYGDEYAEMVTSVNKYHGFYIGRYETTIDASGNIGSVYNTPVLTADKTMFTKNSTNYPYRWYGMYYASKTTSYIVANGTNVQSAMIYGQLWDKMIAYFDQLKAAGKELDYSATPVNRKSSSGNIINSAQSTYTYEDKEIKDEILNIYDLRRNGWDWIQEAYSTYDRVKRGGYYNGSVSASSRFSFYPTSSSFDGSSRLALYIK